MVNAGPSDAVARCLRAGALGLLALFAGAAGAAGIDQYPNRPIRMIIPFAPGGATDNVARSISPRLSEHLGQPIIIDNRSGAGGNVGVRIAATATPDGHVLLFGNQGPISINPPLYTKLQHQATRELIPITQVADQPDVLLVPPSLPVQSIKELISYLRERKGKVNFGSAGNSTRFEMEIFKKAANLEMTHVPYKGGGPVAAALLGSEIQLAFSTMSAALAHATSGRLKALAVTSARRSIKLPAVPTFAESGFPILTGGSWQGIFAPKGTPQPIVGRLFSTIAEKVMREDEVRQRLESAGMDVVISGSQAEFAKFVASENARWARIVTEIGAKEE